MELYNSGGVYAKDAYEIACRFYDNFFGPPIIVDLRLEPIFWTMIQAGLLAEDGLTEKRSTHLLKRVIHTSQSEGDQTTWTKYFL